MNKDTIDMPTQTHRRPWYKTFHGLMPYRVQEILLVSSPYDAFTLEEDGRLTESVFTAYSELSLTRAPRITHVSSGVHALELLAERNFDLVLSMVRLADTDVSAFARSVKASYPKMPVILLGLTEADLAELPGGIDTKVIDNVFVWTGDARMLLSIIKLIEDKKNVAHDTNTAATRVIILVEDSPRRYTSSLTFLYQELMAQSESLGSEGVNDLHRLMRLRTRPKILLATTYEEAMEYYIKYSEYIATVLTDLRFPRGGEEDPRAGFALIKEIRKHNTDMPIVLETAEDDVAEIAQTFNVFYVDKRSSHFNRTLRHFLYEILGFGDFVFRLPDRTEVGRARNMFELEQLLCTVPPESVALHASHNHFSTWLMARSMFDLAKLVRPQNSENLGGVEHVREYLIKVLHEERLHEQEGVIVDFVTGRTSAESHFLRLSKGSIGGKARGVAFLSSLIARNRLSTQFPGLHIRTPRSVVIGTNEFDRFIEHNLLSDLVTSEEPDDVIRSRCLGGRLSTQVKDALRKAVLSMNGPLAVRSSSLLEDSQLQPFAGIYATYMLPNNHPDPEVRHNELCQAIKAVYASVFCEEARTYIAGTPHNIADEKMAVLIQEIVGRTYGHRFYPDISGVALSTNYYPVGHQRAEDGLAMIALGLGHTVVKGGQALQFSPKDPTLLPQFGTPREMLRYSQSFFYALDMSKQRLAFSGDERFLCRCELVQAEKDGPLSFLGSVYSPEDDVIRDDLSYQGPRIVTFNNILKWNATPLAPALSFLLNLCKENLGNAIEMEFAVDLGSLIKVRAATHQEPTLYVLQVRPQAVHSQDGDVDTTNFASHEILAQTDRSLGHGILHNIYDVVYVKRNDLSPLETPTAASQVAQFNADLIAEKRPYLLIGPGRWGSSDARLGVPVKWSQIAGAKVIMETNFDHHVVEPSQGSHFFHNITSLRIGYLTLGKQNNFSSLDYGWLNSQPAHAETSMVRHLRLLKPLYVYLDGRHGKATIIKPEAIAARHSE